VKLKLIKGVKVLNPHLVGEEFLKDILSLIPKNWIDTLGEIRFFTSVPQEVRTHRIGGVYGEWDYKRKCISIYLWPIADTALYEGLGFLPFLVYLIPHECYHVFQDRKERQKPGWAKEKEAQEKGIEICRRFPWEKIFVDRQDGYLRKAKAYYVFRRSIFNKLQGLKRKGKWFGES